MTKEKHLLYVQTVKKVREAVNIKLEELRVDMAKEVAVISHDFSTLHTKVDIIAVAVTNVMKWYQSLILKVDKIEELDTKSFSKIEDSFINLNDLVSKISSSSSLITPNSLSQKFAALESILKAELDPLANLLNLMSTTAPPIQTRVQGGEGIGVSIGVSSKVSMGEVDLRKEMTMQRLLER
ncbi:unnamed protein product [Lactuca saligna]|uniref:Uncharacterized protein n=1 Tax=Lactuca saligna TaxID=75948 RepID=A0AA36DXT4_LACSI|nr:unnamed protein product [Lactuca saligna]